jgi:heme oxygenase
LSSDLAQRLKRDTAVLHGKAESTGIMRALLAGAVDRTAYASLLHALHAVYDALERALVRHAAHAAVRHVHRPALFRTAALAHDLRALRGPGWCAAPPCSAARRYAARLQSIDAEAPELLVAHAYVRYLGDLSGGRVLQRRVRESLQLDAACLSFFAYDADVSAHELADDFRRGLDAIDSDEPRARGIVAEAQSAFERHIEIFEELAPATAGPAHDRGAHPANDRI